MKMLHLKVHFSLMSKKDFKPKSQYFFKLLISGFAFLVFSCGENIKKKEFEKPEEKWAPFYAEVLKKKIVPSEKAWADAVPKGKKIEVLAFYEAEKIKPNFSLKAFVDSTFYINKSVNASDSSRKINFNQYVETKFLSLLEKGIDDEGSMIPTRKKYISGGDLHNEFSYANAYFVYKGLEALKREDLCEDLILNFLQYLQDYGHVPPANRTYALESSELPVLGLIMEEHCKKHPEKLQEYASQLTKEYQYWMASENAEETKKFQAAKSKGVYRSVVFLPNGESLNRYFTIDSSRRSDFYLSDANFSKAVLNQIRTESMCGVKIQNRFKEPVSDHIPIDLNALLYKTETFLAMAYRKLNKVTYAKSFENLAKVRKKNMLALNFVGGIGFDYNFKLKKNTQRINVSYLWAILCDVETKTETFNKIVSSLESTRLLKNGSEDADINLSYNYLAYLSALKVGETTKANMLKKEILDRSQSFFRQNGQVSNNLKAGHEQRVDAVLAVLNALKK
jgi:alpha,alpha-trehalase